METQEWHTELINNYLNGSATKDELLGLLEWIKAEPTNINYFNQLCYLWENGIETEVAQNDTELALFKLNQRINEYDESETRKVINFKIGYRQLLQIAAVLIGIAIVPFVAYYYFMQKPESPQTFVSVITPVSQKSQIILPDGTKVWLNSGTSLKYGSNYNLQTREVYLEGEAFFNVAKNKEKPFLVHASKITVRALGTSFDVKCYDYDKTIETTLVEGSVQVTIKNTQKETKGNVILKPNEKASFKKLEEKFMVSKLEPKLIKKNGKLPANPSGFSGELKTLESVIAWKDQPLIFENETLEVMTKRLEQWFNVTILINNESLKNNRYTGKFVNNESLEDILKIFAKTTTMNYSIKNKTIIIEK